MDLVMNPGSHILKNTPSQRNSVVRNSMIRNSMEEKNTRLNKYLASCGVCSRRQADILIESGAVTVNGQVAKTGVSVSSKDVVAVNGKNIEVPNEHIVLAYYKPVGVVCTEKDKHASRTVVTELGYEKRVTYAGRLDKDSEGLLIMTDDGDLIQAMMKGANGHEKEYIVKVNKEVKNEDVDFLAKGVYLKELKQKTRPCTVEKVGKYTLRFVLTQGLNRQIRRMCKEKSYQVVSLKRTRVMNIFLASLLPGEYREITGEEKETLYKMCGLKS